MQPPWAPKAVTAPLSWVAPPVLRWSPPPRTSPLTPQLLLLSQPETAFPPSWTTLPLPSSLCSLAPLGMCPRHLTQVRASPGCLSTDHLPCGGVPTGTVSISPLLLLVPLCQPLPFPNRLAAPQPPALEPSEIAHSLGHPIPKTWPLGRASVLQPRDRPAPRDSPEKGGQSF